MKTVLRFTFDEGFRPLEEIGINDYSFTVENPSFIPESNSYVDFKWTQYIDDPVVVSVLVSMHQQLIAELFTTTYSDDEVEAEFFLLTKEMHEEIYYGRNKERDKPNPVDKSKTKMLRYNLHEYIDRAKNKNIKALYTMLEKQLDESINY